MFKIEILDSHLDTLKDYGQVSLRVGLGVVFLAHGGQKLFGLFGGSGLSGAIGFVEMMGFHPAFIWGTLLACTEFFGGLLALIGLFTRWAGLSLAGVMATAILTVHLKNGLFLADKGFEYAGSLLCMAVALIILGGGKLSVDGWLRGRNQDSG
ncbi:MAG: DoxX family protein [Nitrospinaceae bacterium]